MQRPRDLKEIDPSSAFCRSLRFKPDATQSQPVAEVERGKVRSVVTTQSTEEAESCDKEKM